MKRCICWHKRSKKSRFLPALNLSSEIVRRLCFLEVPQESGFDYRLVHHGRTTEVIFNFFRFRMVLRYCSLQYRHDEAFEAISRSIDVFLLTLPVGLQEVDYRVLHKFKIGEFFLFDETRQCRTTPLCSSTIPERYFSISVLMEHVEQMGS